MKKHLKSPSYEVLGVTLPSFGYIENVSIFSLCPIFLFFINDCVSVFFPSLYSSALFLSLSYLFLFTPL